MARQTLTATNVTGAYPTAGTVLTATAADATNKEEVILTGRELLIARNSGLSSRNVTITSVADPRTGRTGDITDSVAAGATKIFGPFAIEGWMQSTGKLYFEAAHADILWSVIKLA